MNKERRKTIEELQTRLGAIVNNGELDSIKEGLEPCAEDEREYFDNMPENLQTSERGENAEVAATALENACEKIDEAKDALQDALNDLEEALL